MIKVLIADDEPLVRAGIKTVLPWNMYGFDVISEAADGKEAYEKILKLKPDILITDIKMPGMDGITLLKRLKQEKISIQSLVLSCFDEFELVREAMKYGAHDYIRKLSIDPAKLLEVLKEMKEAISDQPEKNASFRQKFLPVPALPLPCPQLSFQLLPCTPEYFGPFQFFELFQFLELFQSLELF